MTAGEGRGKTVIVTGASGQVAGATTARLAEAGYEVVPVDRVAGTVPGGTEVLPCDITDTAQVVSLIEQIRAAGNGLYGLVNAAALIPTAGVWDVEPDEFAQVMSVNTWGSFNIAREASKLMAESGSGRIVNIASVAAYTGGLVGGPHYAASKAGLLVLTKILAKELARRGITVNAIAPGALETPATDSLGDEARASLLGRIPKGRLGTRDEIAEAVGFLLAEGADYITGATLDINGGVYLR